MYSYKGIDIANAITDNTGSTIPGYNLIGTATNHTGLRPLPFGITYQGTPLSNYCTARNAKYNSSGDVPIPSGCKIISFVGMSGGGGGGGKGGDGKAGSGGKSATGVGGTGGSGSPGTYMYGLVPVPSNANYLSVGIGNGGNAGANGNNASNNTSVLGTTNANGKGGSPGNAGNYTALTFPNIISYYTSNAPGGNGGGSGSATYKQGTTDSNSGGNGNTGGYGGDTNYNTSLNYPGLGNGYPGGPGGPGGPGSLQIIWLYD
jgi:hypothetical protein